MKYQIQRLINAAKRDKQQTGTVLGLIAVGMLLWGRLLLKQVPQTASADDKPAWLAEVEAEVQGQVIGPRGAALVLTIPVAPSRDPFLLDSNRYKRALLDDNLINGAKLDEELTDDAKRERVVEEAHQLRLQSITMGDVPAAFINGRLIRINGSIDGFELLTCDERSAVLVKHGIKVRLGMGSDNE